MENRTYYLEGIVDINGRELLTHGSEAFPAQYYEQELKSDPVPWHWHEEYEVGWIVSGTCTMYDGFCEISLTEGDGFFINSKSLHQMLSPKEPCVLRSIVFSYRLIADCENSAIYQRYLLPILSDTSIAGFAFRQTVHKDCISLIQHAWNTYQEKKFGYEVWIRNHLSLLFIQLRDAFERQPLCVSPTLLRSERRVRTMLTFIEEHLSEKLSVAQISASCTVSESECLRCFRQILHTTPMKYVLENRLRKAEQLLCCTDAPVSEIAETCGFTDMSYFARLFRQSFGLPPREYRKRKESWRC